MRNPIHGFQITGRPAEHDHFFAFINQTFDNTQTNSFTTPNDNETCTHLIPLPNDVDQHCKTFDNKYINTRLLKPIFFAIA